MCIVYMYVLFHVHEYGDEQSSRFEHPNQEERKIRRQQQSIASCIQAAPTNKQLLPQ